MKLKEMFKGNKAVSAYTETATPLQVSEAAKKLTKKSNSLDNYLPSTDYDKWLDGYKSRNPTGHNKITGLE